MVLTYDVPNTFPSSNDLEIGSTLPFTSDVPLGASVHRRIGSITKLLGVCYPWFLGYMLALRDSVSAFIFDLRT